MAKALTFMLAGAALAVAQGVVGALSELNRPVVAAVSLASDVIVDVLSWLVGLGAIVLLWQRDSTAFFQSSRRFPA